MRSRACLERSLERRSLTGRCDERRLIRNRVPAIGIGPSGGLASVMVRVVVVTELRLARPRRAVSTNDGSHKRHGLLHVSPAEQARLPDDLHGWCARQVVRPEMHRRLPGGPIT